MGAWVAGAFVSAWLVVLCVYDIRERRLPNWLTMPGALAILAVAAAVGCGVPALLGAIGLAGLYVVVHLISPAAMGAGDVKLAAVIAPLLTAIWACVYVVRRSETAVPHGPSMCLATVVATTLAIV